jgi:hypothetical protein
MYLSSKAMYQTPHHNSIKTFIHKIFIQEWDPLKMSYFDNFDNESLNKYKNRKIEKSFKCVLLLLDRWSFKFHVISLSFDSPSKPVKVKPLQIT